MAQRLEAGAVWQILKQKEEDIERGIKGEKRRNTIERLKDLDREGLRSNLGEESLGEKEGLYSY